MHEAPANRIHKGLHSRYPLFYLLSQEEERVERLLVQCSAAHYQDARPVIQWTAARGFFTQEGRVDATRDPVAAVQYILDAGRDAFYLMKDLPALLSGNPLLVRALRDLYQALTGRETHVFLSYTKLVLPDELKNQVFMVDLALPGESELFAYLQALVAHAGVAGLDDDWCFGCAAAMRGMAFNEVRHLFSRLVQENKLDLASVLPEIHAEKAAALMKEGCLKYIDKTIDLEQLGGLENLREWVESRKRLFSKAAFEEGVPLPNGVLFMGVSGCGKSMAAKVIAAAWKLPLVRLDMNLVLSGAHGAPEYAFDHALRVAEQIAPMVLWIDEMENSFGYDVANAGGGSNNSIFSSFLTWMQEKPPSVFVVATANRIEKLPAEVMRKGRFDQLFFLDLPTDEERRAILAIHIRAYGADPATFNLGLLSAATQNWSGAEIEQAIKGARIHAYEAQRMFNERDVLWNTSRMVPLSRTMEEQIKHLRQWSQERATPASRKGKT